MNPLKEAPHSVALVNAAALERCEAPVKRLSIRVHYKRVVAPYERVPKDGALGAD